MARTNKYTSLNFNEIYEKKKISTSTTTSPSSSLSSKSPSSSLSSAHKSYSFSASSHGGMLVLSRPSPKPAPPPSPSPPSPSFIASKPPSASISLRPQLKYGSGHPPSERETNININNNGNNNGNNSIKEPPSPLPKTDKFVPPHLRRGFVAKDHAPIPPPPDFHKSRAANHRPGSGHGHHGSPNRYGDDGRPKSGGGYDRRIRGPGAYDSDLVDFNRPRSRPSSSGWAD